MGWGADTLVVKAESPEGAREVASQLRSFGFEAIEDEADAEAGMLLLSRNRAATIANNTSEICATNGRAGLRPGAYIFSG